MSFQKTKTNSFCSGQKRYSGTKNNVGEKAFKKTVRMKKLLDGQRSICYRKNIINVSNNTIEAEGLSNCFKNSGEKVLHVSKNLAENVLSVPTRALNFTANIASAAATRYPEKF